MAVVPFTEALLQSECQTDSQALGLTTLFSHAQDAAVAAILNLPRAGAPYQQTVGVIPAYVIVNVIDQTELATVTGNNLIHLQLIISAGIVDSGNANVQATFVACFPNANGPSRQAFLLIGLRQGSRAEALWGAGTIITAAQVAGARP